MNTYKIVLFDVDDTLYFRSDPFRKAAGKLFGERVSGADILKLYTDFHVRGDEVFAPAHSGKITMEEMYIYRTVKGFADSGISVTDQEALDFQKEYEKAQKQIGMPEEVCSLLSLLKKKGIPMGIVTNGPSEHQRNKANALGLERFMDPACYFVSGDCGVWKPDPGMFRYVEKKLGLQGKEILYAGDSYTNDICGAAAVNWCTIWLNYGFRKLTAGMLRPDFEVHTAKEMCRQIITLLEIEDGEAIYEE